MRNDEFGGARGARDVGFNELFCSPLVPPLNRRFNQCLSSRTTPFSLPVFTDQYPQPIERQHLFYISNFILFYIPV